MTKTELAALLWPDEQYRDFDRAIHNLISKLRRMHPQASSWFETVRKAGYRFCLPVTEERWSGEALPRSESLPKLPREFELSTILSETTPSSGDEPQPLENAEVPMPMARVPSRWRLGAGALAIGCALIVCLVGWKAAHRRPAETAPNAPVIVGVLPLTVSAADEATGETLRGALSDAIAALPNVEVRAEHSLPSTAGVSATALQGTARDLKLDLLLAGSLVTSPAGYRLNLELIRASDGAHVRSLHYQGATASLGTLSDRVAGDLAPRLITSDNTQEAQHALGGDDKRTGL